MNQYGFPPLRQIQGRGLHAKMGKHARLMSIRSALACAIAVSAGPWATSALAQAGRAPAAPPAVGLDSLSDDAVMSELSGLKLDSLLNHMFDANHVPKDKQESIKSLGALRELSATQAVGNNRRIVLVKRAVDGLNALLPTMTDPSALMTYTGQLVAKGIEPDINTLEYWGENPMLQARVKPAADIASKMLEQVSNQAETQQKQIENAGIHGANDPNGDRWQKLDDLRNQAKYYDAMIAYYRAMANDTSGGKNAAAVKERSKICDGAITYLLDPFDLPGADGGGVQPLVHNRIGKLELAKGDYAAAKGYFNAIIIGKTPDGKPIDPAPNATEVYEARYFLVVCDVLGKKPDLAEKELAELDAWQKKTLPPEAQSGVDAAADMLRYRLLSAKADLAKTNNEKEELNKQADGVLTALEKSHPEFSSIITEQLVNRLPETANLNEQGVSVLQALIAKGNAERYKPENVPMDEKVVNRAVAAAKVLITRKEGVSPRELQDATLLIAMLLDRQNKPVDAANAYLDFADHYAVDPNAGAAVDRAVTLAYPLGHSSAKDELPIKTLYKRALSTAVNLPWSRKELYYFYADYLRSIGDTSGAVTFYRKVPAGDKMEFPARFFELLSLDQELNSVKTTPADRQKDIAEAFTLVDQIRRLGPSVPQTDSNKFRLAYSTLLGAGFSIEDKQPAKALQLLANFNAEAATVAQQSDQLLQRATYYRAQAYIADKKFDNATQEVIKLSAKSPDAAKDLATSLLDQLSKDYDRQLAQHQTTELAETASNEAKLTGFMVNFCEHSPVAKIKALTPEYQLYDAKMKLNAGNLAYGADRTQKLNEALNAYLKIKQLRPDDPNAAYGEGLTQFALGQWSEAAATLGTLLRDGKLGGPTIPGTDKVTGEQSFKDNSAYWEATYKWIKSNFEQAKSLPNDPTMQKVMAGAKQALKDDFTNYQDSTGGGESVMFDGRPGATQFEELRKEIIPDFDPHALLKAPSSNPSTSPTTAPAAPPPTQPVAGIGK
jgi:hypothetical protein